MYAFATKILLKLNVKSHAKRTRLVTNSALDLAVNPFTMKTMKSSVLGTFSLTDFIDSKRFVVVVVPNTTYMST